MKKETKTIYDYFENIIDYPTDIADNPLPYGIIYKYISTIFLNGFINYVKPLACFVLNTDHDEKVSKIFIQKALLDFENDKHTRLRDFESNIIILAEIDKFYTNDYENEFRYMYFYFDYDVSDCSIGKFKTNDSQEKVVQSIRNLLDAEIIEYHIQDREDSELLKSYEEIPISHPKGWISF